MEKKNSVFIATSIDGYIADRDGGIKWLDTIPEINTIDTGYHAFTENVDALVMGRTTFETVLGFDIEWPYQKPVYVVSRTLSEIPAKLVGKVQFIKGTLSEILKQVHAQGHHRLYIDGGTLIQSFLAEDMIDEMVITVIPVLLGGGIPLFGAHNKILEFECFQTKHYLDAIVQNHFARKRCTLSVRDI